MTTTLFLHGLDSSGQGTKGRYLSKHFPHVHCPNFAGSLQERLQQLEQICRDKENLILIGSSFGGLMATCYAIDYPEKVQRLILLAPALNFEDYSAPERMLDTPTILVIGEEDEVTPPELVLPLAEKTFGDLEVQLEDDDHLLHLTFRLLDWPKLLQG